MNYILQYDEELDLDFEIPELDASIEEILNDTLLSNQHDIRMAMLSALHNGIEMKLDRIPVFAVKDSDFIFVLPKEEYSSQLDKSIAYFSNLEEYETCSDLAKLKELLP